MSVNPEILAGQPWGIVFPSDPTPADSSYNVNTLGFTAAGGMFIITDNTAGAAVWEPFGFSGHRTYRFSTIDGTSQGNTVILTTRSDLGRFYVTRVIVRLISTTGFVSVPTVQMGTNSPGFNNIVPAAVITGLSTNNLYFPLTLGATPASVAAGANLTFRVAVAAVATTFDIGIAVEGIYA